MSQGHIRLDRKGPVAWITIDNQAKRNAVSLGMWEQLDEALQQIGEEIRCIVLRGAGEKAFVSGADISEFVDQRREPEAVAAYDAISDAAMERLHSMPQPTVAMISGYCFGGGVALALCCDIRFADETSQFAVPAARLGVGYGATGLKHLLDVVSVPVATDIMISARRYSAEEALGIGLLNRVYPADALVREVEDYAATIASNAPLAVRAAKRTIKELARSHASVDLDLCREINARCFASQDYVEGAEAFMAKRVPQFKGC